MPEQRKPSWSTQLVREGTPARLKKLRERKSISDGADKLNAAVMETKGGNAHTPQDDDDGEYDECVPTQLARARAAPACYVSPRGAHWRQLAARACQSAVSLATP